MSRCVTSTRIIPTILALGSTGCSLTTHPPKIQFLESGRATWHLQHESPLAGGRPILEGGINGVNGPFIIDTGANVPHLTMTAVRRCHLSLSPGKTTYVDVNYAGRVTMKVVEDVTLVIHPRITVRWSIAVVDPVERSYFGLIDYQTLKAMHAVIDIAGKTITVSQ